MGRIIITNGKALTIRELPVEKLLNDKGLAATVGESVRVRQDRAASLANAARHATPLVEAAVQRYKLAMANGDIFPMPVVVRRKNPVVKLWDTILGGNNRDAAWASHGVLSYDAYIVDHDERRLELIYDILPKALNLLHGAMSSEDQILRDAMFKVDSKMSNLRRIAEDFKLTPETLRTHVQTEKVQVLVQNEGVDVIKVRATGTLLYALWNFNPIRVRAAMGCVAVSGGLTKAELRTMMIEVGAQPNEAAMLNIVDRWALEHPEKSRRRVDRTGGAALCKRIQGAIHVLSVNIAQKRTLAELGFDVRNADVVTKLLASLRVLNQKTSPIELDAVNILRSLAR